MKDEKKTGKVNVKKKYMESLRENAQLRTRIKELEKQQKLPLAKEMKLVKKENEMFVDIVDELVVSLLTKKSAKTGQLVESVSAFFDEYGHKY